MSPPSQSGRQTATGIAILLISAIAVAIMPSGAKLAYEAGSAPLTVLLLRCAIGVLLLGSGALAVRGSLRIPRALLGRAVLTGLAASLMSYGFYGAIARIEISLAILIMFTHPFLIAGITHLRGDGSLGGRYLLCGLVAFGGLGLALAVDLSRLDPLGIGLAALGSLACTAMVLGNARLSQEVGSLLSNFYLTLISTAVFALALLGSGDVRLPSGTVGWLGAISTGVAFAVAYATFFAAARIIGVSRASLLSIIEPVFTILLAMALFGETLSALQWIGVALVLGGLFAAEAPGSWLRPSRKA
ncbi:MAG: DMT family transporter [Pseudomonadota bacterium]